MSSKPFTYLIGWTLHRAFYYGVRYGNNVHPSTLWTTYFTSSTVVKNFRELHGEPDIIQIRRTFKSANAAKCWEHKVLKRMQVVKRSDFLNQNDKPAPPSRLGAKHTAQSREKMKKPLAVERKKKISDSLRGTNQKLWLITTPDTEFCIKSLDCIREYGWGGLYSSFRYNCPLKKGPLKGWKLSQIGL